MGTFSPRRARVRVPKVQRGAAGDGGCTSSVAEVACGLVVLPKRWIVERASSWLNRCRRLADPAGHDQAHGKVLGSLVISTAGL